MHPFINILGRTIPTYSICVFAGIILAFPALIFLSKRFDVKIEDGIYSFLYAFIGLLIGAKVLFLILNLPALPQIYAAYGFPALFKYGFVIYGGLSGAFLGTWIYCKQFHLEATKIFSLLITVTPLIQALGRIGCFFAGCCYGFQYDGKFSIVLSGVHRFPVQILCSGLNLLLFLFLLGRAFFSKNRFLQFPIYLICYSAGRFLVEYLRADLERGFFLIFSTSQWISIGFFLAGVIILARTVKATRQRP